MGLTYKENVPDTRESPVREIVKELKEFGVETYGYDPLLSKEEIEGFGVKALDNLDVKIKMDGVIVAVAHDVFKRKTLDEIKKFMNDKPVMIDVRGMFCEEAANGIGFYYKGIVMLKNKPLTERTTFLEENFTFLAQVLSLERKCILMCNDIKLNIEVKR